MNGSNFEQSQNQMHIRFLVSFDDFLIHLAIHPANVDIQFLIFTKNSFEESVQYSNKKINLSLRFIKR